MKRVFEMVSFFVGVVVLLVLGMPDTGQNEKICTKQQKMSFATCMVELSK